MIGELARTGYVEASAMGVDAFVHTTRYSLGLASDELRRGIDAEPFSNDLDSAKGSITSYCPNLRVTPERSAPMAKKLPTVARRSCRP